MSNSQLKREVNRLQSELRKIERENEALKEDIGEAVGAVSAAESLRTLRSLNPIKRSFRLTKCNKELMQYTAV